jgi:hypothetical protein
MVYMDLVTSSLIGRSYSFHREVSWHSSFRGSISSIIYESRDTAPKKLGGLNSAIYASNDTLLYREAFLLSRGGLVTLSSKGEASPLSSADLVTPSLLSPDERRRRWEYKISQIWGSSHMWWLAVVWRGILLSPPPPTPLPPHTHSGNMYSTR